MTITGSVRPPAEATDGQKVENYRGIWIGRVLAADLAVNHRGVRLGRVTTDGNVVDDTGVRIGRVRS